MRVKEEIAEADIVDVVPSVPVKSKRGANLKKYQFPKGVSGNPGGKPVGARNTLTGNFLKCLSADFDKHGPKVISRARNKDPVGYMKVIANLLPKQMEATRPLDDMSDAELAAGIALLRSRLSINDRDSTSAGSITQET